uniref:beta-glucosidase n=1 Tax=Emiliania huxleyi TaxID=2903 RepID=A0A7S3SW08_EMIHU
MARSTSLQAPAPSSLRARSTPRPRRSPPARAASARPPAATRGASPSSSASTPSTATPSPPTPRRPAAQGGGLGAASLHAPSCEQATILPHNIGLGAADDESLTAAAGAATATEVAAAGLNWAFGPCVASPRDSRWGRTYEGFGADEQLVSRHAAAAVTGLQAPADERADLTRPFLPAGARLVGRGRARGRVAACAKHFAADGATLSGADEGDADLDAVGLAEHLLPYRAAVQAGVLSVMVSYSSVRGTKMHANKELLSGFLKEHLGFGGLVVSDLGGVDQLRGGSLTRFAAAINAGVDMVMLPGTWTAGGAASVSWQTFLDDVERAVLSGEVPRARVDDAAARVLAVKAAIGLVSPFGDPAPEVEADSERGFGSRGPWAHATGGGEGGGEGGESARMAGGVGAVVAAWLPGSEGGGAIADLLFGVAPFRGKLPLPWVGAYPAGHGTITVAPPQPPRPPPPPPSPLPPPFDFWSAWGVAEQGASIAFGTATALVSGTAGPAVDLLAGGYAAEQFRPSLPPLPPPSTPPLAARGLDISLAVAPPLAGLLGVAAAARWLLARRNKPAAESQRAVLV